MCKECLFCSYKENDLYKKNRNEKYFKKDNELVYECIEGKEKFLDFYYNEVLSEIIDDTSLGICEECIDEFKYELIDELSKKCSIREMDNFINFMIHDVTESLNISIEEYIDYSIDRLYNDINKETFFYYLDENCRDKYIIIRQYLGLTAEKLSSSQHNNDEINHDISSRQ